jgi:hypothetical protein
VCGCMPVQRVEAKENYSYAIHNLKQSDKWTTTKARDINFINSKTYYKYH